MKRRGGLPTRSHATARAPSTAPRGPSKQPPQEPKATREPLIELSGIYKAFGEQVIFEDMDLTIYEGELLSILGESGTGKSIASKMAVGLVQPDDGQVLFRGRDVLEMDRDELRKLRKEVSYVFQEDALFDSMTILENVGYGLYEHTRMSDDEIRERARRSLEVVGLEERVLDLMPANLSGGMRKRVGLARAVVTEPKIVLFDDPTRGLDPQSITRIGRMIADLRERFKITAVLITHDLRTAFAVSDRLTVLHDHKFPYSGTLDELRALDDPAINDFLYDPDAAMRRRWAEADARHAAARMVPPVE